MKKMTTLFVIDHENDVATTEVSKGAEWVFTDKAIATIKFDGTSCLFKDGKIWKRFDRKLKKNFLKKARQMGKDFKPTLDMFKEVPEDAIPCMEKPDPITHHFPHWVPVGEGNEDRWHREAFNNAEHLIEGKTYELVGPKIQKNPYNLEKHELWEHGKEVVPIEDMTFEGLKNFLENLNAEGIVWHNVETGEMIKWRRKDLKFDWNN